MIEIVVSGATGLVGQALVAQLAQDSEVKVKALTRRGGTVSTTGRVEEVVFDYDDLAGYEKMGQPAILFCCLGTTIKKAGSKDRFLYVDKELPCRLLRYLADHSPQTVFGLVSSVGADEPRGFYLETKAELEAEVSASGLTSVIVRPSLLVGDRAEFRPGERVAEALLTPAFKVLSALGGHRSQTLMKYAPITATDVARALVKGTRAALTDRESRLFEGRDLRK